MSVRASDWAWKQSTPSPSARLVLLALADHCDEDGFTYPTIKYLSTMCQLSPRSIQLHLTALQSAGLITKSLRIAPNGKPTSSLFQLSLVKLVTPMKPASSMQSVTGDGEAGYTPMVKPVTGGMVKPASPHGTRSLEPSHEPSHESLAPTRKKSFTKAEIDPVKNELARVCGIIPASPEEWGPIQKAAYIVLVADGTAAQVEPFFNNLNSKYEGRVVIKPMTLATRWGEASSASPPRPSVNGSKPRGGRSTDIAEVDVVEGYIRARDS